MGNKIGGYTFPTEAVIAETVRTVNLFGQLYAKSVGIAALRTRQRAHEEEHEGYEKVHNRDGFMLERPPEASEPIERAWITKLGDVKKNWKRRFFVATEEADNFVIYYFERDKDAATPTKAKGSIYPCGYVIRDTLPEEVKCTEPGFGLALEPVDRKRVWYLRFESAELRETWRQVLQFSSVKCEAPLSPDRVLSAAYRDAYSHARRQLGLHGYFKLDRSEKEQLAVLCVQACETNVLSSLYETITNSVTAAAGGAGAVDPKTLAEAEKLRAAVDKELDKIVTTVLDTAWPAISARVDMRKPVLEGMCSSNLAAILREEALRRGEVSERVSKHIRPIARDAAAPCVSILLGGLLKPQYKAHKDALKLFWNKVHEIVETGLKENELRLFYRDSRWQYKSLKGVFSKVVAHCTNFVALKFDGIHPWLQVRVLTRGDLDEAGGDSAIKLLSELTIPLPQFADLLKVGQLAFAWMPACFHALGTLAGCIIVRSGDTNGRSHPKHDRLGYLLVCGRS
jgi:hypothetical protein